jgi:hypothetical protein
MTETTEERRARQSANKRAQRARDKAARAGEPVEMVKCKRDGCIVLIHVNKRGKEYCSRYCKDKDYGQKHKEQKNAPRRVSATKPAHAPTRGKAEKITTVACDLPSDDAVIVLGPSARTKCDPRKGERSRNRISPVNNGTPRKGWEPHVRNLPANERRLQERIEAVAQWAEAKAAGDVETAEAIAKEWGFSGHSERKPWGGHRNGAGRKSDGGADRR